MDRKQEAREDLQRFYADIAEMPGKGEGYARARAVDAILVERQERDEAVKWRAAVESERDEIARQREEVIKQRDDWKAYADEFREQRDALKAELARRHPTPSIEPVADGFGLYVAVIDRVVGAVSMRYEYEAATPEAVIDGLFAVVARDGDGEEEARRDEVSARLHLATNRIDELDTALRKICDVAGDAIPESQVLLPGVVVDLVRGLLRQRDATQPEGYQSAARFRGQLEEANAKRGKIAAVGAKPIDERDEALAMIDRLTKEREEALKRACAAETQNCTTYEDAHTERTHASWYGDALRQISALTGEILDESERLDHEKVVELVRTMASATEADGSRIRRLREQCDEALAALKEIDVLLHQAGAYRDTTDPRLVNGVLGLTAQRDKARKERDETSSTLAGSRVGRDAEYAAAHGTLRDIHDALVEANIPVWEEGFSLLDGIALLVKLNEAALLERNDARAAAQKRLDALEEIATAVTELREAWNALKTCENTESGDCPESDVEGCKAVCLALCTVEGLVDPYCEEEKAEGPVKG